MMTMAKVACALALAAALGAAAPPPQSAPDRIPDFGANPTLVSRSSGAWSDAGTWNPSRIPAQGDVVSIGAGHAVTYDVMAEAALRSVVVRPGGALRFRTDVGTKLVLSNLVVDEGGELRIGTASEPVEAEVRAEIVIANAPLDLGADPQQWGNGLVCRGTLTMHGAAKSPTHARLAAEPRAGDATLSLSQPVTGWRAGDRLVLPDSRWVNDAPDLAQLELATLAGVSNDGRVLMLASPVQFEHPGARNVDGILEFLPHVGNLTRNVVLKSQSATGTFTGPDGRIRSTRGHAIFMDRAEVDIRHAGFSGLGRTTMATVVGAPDDTVFDESGAVVRLGGNQSRRHPVTFYKLSDPGPSAAPRFTFTGNSIQCPLADHVFRWGLALEGAHRGRVSRNVLYNWAGASVNVGSEIECHENVIEDNLAVLTRSNGDSRDLGNGGGGFTFWGSNNWIRRNVSANSGSYEFIFAGGGPFLEFADHEAYGARSGLTVWNINGADTGGANPGAPRSEIRNFRVWHVSLNGFFGYPSYNITFDGFTARNLPGNPAGIGWTFGDYTAKDMILRNADIQGFANGVEMPLTQSAWGAVAREPFLLENSLLRNYTNVYGYTPAGSGGSGGVFLPKTSVIRNVRFGSLPDAPGFAGNDGSIIPQTHITMIPQLADGANMIQKDDVLVYDYNGVPGDRFRVYYREQRADWILGQTADQGATVGSPVAGLTNAQNWAAYGISFAGSVAPAGATSRPAIEGLLGPIPSNRSPVIAGPPVVSPSPASPGAAVNFTVSAGDPDGDPLRVTWMFHDGTTLSGTSVSRTYASPGVYAVFVAVSDATSSVTAAENVWIASGVPDLAPAFTLAPSGWPNPAPLFQIITFTAEAVDPEGGPVTYFWDFGDGTSGTGAMALHSYLAGGTYTARVTATDGSGLSTSASVEVSVAFEPIPPPPPVESPPSPGEITSPDDPPDPGPPPPPDPVGQDGGDPPPAPPPACGATGGEAILLLGLVWLSLRGRRRSQ